MQFFFDSFEFILSKTFQYSTKSRIEKALKYYDKEIELERKKRIAELIRQGIDVNIKFSNGYHPLFHFYRYGQHFDLIILLIQNGANINEKDEYEQTLLHHAASHNDENLANFLISKGANVNLLDNEKMTPLHIACKFRHLEMVKILINNKADLNIKDENDFNALKFTICLHKSDEDINGYIASVFQKKKEILKLLVDKGALLLNDHDIIDIIKVDMKKEHHLIEYSTKTLLKLYFNLRSKRLKVSTHLCNIISIIRILNNQCELDIRKRLLLQLISIELNSIVK